MQALCGASVSARSHNEPANPLTSVGVSGAGHRDSDVDQEAPLVELRGESDLAGDH